MKLTDDNTALTHWMDENDNEYEIKLSFIYNPAEKQTNLEEGCPAHVDIDGVERWELVGLDDYGWVEFHGETDDEFSDWTAEIYDAIQKQAADNANEDMSEGTIWGRGA